MEIVWTAGLIAALTGLVLALLIVLAAKFFPSEEDPRIGQITALLPGANCGGCGFAGCADMAKNIAEGKAVPAGCAAAGDEAIRAIAELMGMKAGTVERKVAVVLCSGGLASSARAALYNGVSDCRTAASVQNGGKQCRFGCMGFGSCARACRFGAIEVIDGLAVVHPEICKGCGACVAVCPHKLIKLVPVSARVHVYCNSLLPGAARRKMCKAACINCLKCVKKDPERIHVQNGLVRVSLSDPPGVEVLEAGCPVGALATHEQHIAGLLERKRKAEENAETQKRGA